VRGAGYDLTAGEGRRMWEACLERVESHRVAVAAEPEAPLALVTEGPRYGSPQLVLPRLGQGTFRVAVTQAYERACAVTHEHSLPVLEAAHIRSWGDGGPHRVSNGLLLRADVHRLFDAGYVTVTPEMRFVVSRRLRDEFENGKVYYAADGQIIAAPRSAADRPDPDCLRWHNDHVFEKGRAA
jgi:putative restriction endonuclease